MPTPSLKAAQAATVDDICTIFIIDDATHLGDHIHGILKETGCRVEVLPTCEAFLEAYQPGGGECALIAVYRPDTLELLQRLGDEGRLVPTILVAENSDVPAAVHAIKAGASDLIENPLTYDKLLASIHSALEESRDLNQVIVPQMTAVNQIGSLTPRQREILELVLAGESSKNIAADLGVSQRTVENHRASIMKRTGSRSLPELAKVALAAAGLAPRPMQNERSRRQPRRGPNS